MYREESTLAELAAANDKAFLVEVAALERQGLGYAQTGGCQEAEQM
jgi:hypothetical protein